jgi:intein/homing endonuclease
VCCWIKSGGKATGKSKAKRKTKRTQGRNSLKWARRAHFYTKDGQLRVEPRVEDQSRQLAYQVGTEAQEALRRSSKKWNAALSLIGHSRKAWVNGEQKVARRSHEKLDAALSLIKFSREAWVNEDPTCNHTPKVAVAARRLIQLQCEKNEVARNFTIADHRAALTLVKLSRESAHQRSSAVSRALPRRQ